MALFGSVALLSPVVTCELSRCAQEAMYKSASLFQGACSNIPSRRYSGRRRNSRLSTPSTRLGAANRRRPVMETADNYTAASFSIVPNSNDDASFQLDNASMPGGLFRRPTWITICCRLLRHLSGCAHYCPSVCCRQAAVTVSVLLRTKNKNKKILLYHTGWFVTRDTRQNVFRNLNKNI